MCDNTTDAACALVQRSTNLKAILSIGFFVVWWLISMVS